MAGCVTYHPENYLSTEPQDFWNLREDLPCPVCKSSSSNVKSYYGAGIYDTPYIYYYRCFNRHLWVMIEEINKEPIIEVVK